MTERLAHLISFSNALAYQLELGSSGSQQLPNIGERTYKMLSLPPTEAQKILDELRGKDLVPH